MIVRAELIKPYRAPQFQIETVGKACDEGDISLLNEALKGGRAEILASDLGGHPPYTHVIRYHYTDAATDFLAQIDTSEYLVNLP
jgi:hypothetical protein